MSQKRRIWWIMKQGDKFDGPHFSEKKADAACMRARAAGHVSAYVEKI